MADPRPRRPHEQTHAPPPDNVASVPRSSETTPLLAAARRAARSGSAPGNRALVMFASVGSLAIKPTHCHGPRAGRPPCDRLLVPLSGVQPRGHSVNAREPQCAGYRTADTTAEQASSGRRTARARTASWINSHQDDASSVRRPAVLRVARPGRRGICPRFRTSSARLLADELGSGGCFKRAGRNEGRERQHVGYEHAPRAGVQ